MLRKLIIEIVLLTLLHVAATGTDQFYFDNYDTEKGLSHNHVLSIYQDSRGFIWVGTYGGVQAFNGYEFNQFNVVGKNQVKNILSNNVIHVIFEDSKGNLWFGTENGLNKFNPINGKTEQFYTYNGLPSNNIRAICEDDKGNIWIGSYNGGLSKLDVNNNITNFRADNSLRHSLLSNLINTINIDDNNYIWIGSENGGITVFNIATEEVVLNISDLPDNKGNFTVNTFYQDDYQNMWIGTWERGLLKYSANDKKLEQILANTNANSLCGNNIKSILQREKNRLWISTYGNGISILDVENNIFQTVKIEAETRSGNTQDFIWTSFIDSDKNIWFGTYGKGLYRLNTLKSTFPSYKVLYNNQKVSISTIQPINSYEVWLGTMNHGLLRYNLKTKKAEAFEQRSELGSKIHSLLNDSKGNLWIGKGKLYKYISKNKRLITYSHSEDNIYSIPNSIVDHILEDNKGNIWLGLWEGGVYCLPEVEMNKSADRAVFKSIQDISGNDIGIVGNITILWEDSSENIWIGTPEKVHVYNPNAQTIRSINISVAKRIFEDDYGNYWVATNGGGIIKVNKELEIEKKYGFDDGFDCLDIQAMEFDERQRLWMSTSCGLSMLDLRTDIITNFGSNFGFKKYSNILNAAIRKDDMLLFGGGSTLTIFRAASVNREFKTSQVYISNIKINNQSICYENAVDSNIYVRSLIAELDTLIINSESKTITIKFASINFEIPNDIYYAYKMEGVDNEWIISEADNRTVTYSNLKPDTYTFKVKSSFSLGLWNEDIKTFTIVVKPEYYETLLFKVIITLFALLIIALFLGLLIRKNQLVLVLKQKTLFAEELTKEKEILDIKNEELQAIVDQYNNRIKALSVKYQALKENMTSMYKQLVASKLEDSEQSEKQLQQITATINEKISSLDDFNIDKNIELDKDEFLVRFAQAFPKLSSNDLRICTMIRRNISNKDIAEKMNITSGSLEQSRYRMRKKMGLPSDVNLNELILRF